MDIKEVIQYIAEQDLEINLTFQVSSDSEEGLKEEVRQLRKRIDELQISGKASLPETEDLTNEVEPDGPPPEEYHSVDEAPSEDDITEKPDLKNASETGQDGNETQDEENGADEKSEFDEMFGSDETEQESPVEDPAEERWPQDDDEPTEEDREEAEEDFKEVFGLD